MIPTIETIIENLLAGRISKQQAIAWLHQHAEDAGRDLRDEFALSALNGLMASGPHDFDVAADAYVVAEAMLAERLKVPAGRAALAEHEGE